ncbi:FeoC-like transcriptional regulator [Sedimenticola sp.]|uniref:FeoC-like transcriptional regulator n=1 Tax=Sedimenticola sp. TaxID=1940285 RepID=UPI002589CC46|nr:FeoC-like transcriptional regulator [Sedimenticola sp.]MCW8905045.1 FeoC-like transcriptional regulator [Sedimenticola sp.]
MLADIKRYLQNRGPVCLSDIALHLGTTPDAARGMLDTWIRKGRVRHQQLNAACGSSCGKCRPDSMEFYEWSDERSAD